MKKKRIEDFELKDFIPLKPQDEEKTYLDHGCSWQNVRSKVIVESSIKGHDVNTHVVSLKGLPKVFSMNSEFVDKRYRSTFNSKVVNPSRYYKIKNLLLAGAKKCILKSFKVEIVTQKQMESLPVHISWSKNLKTWLVSCATSSFTVDDRTDFRNNEVDPALRQSCK